MGATGASDSPVLAEPGLPVGYGLRPTLLITFSTTIERARCISATPMVPQEDLTSAPGDDPDEEVRQLLEIAQWYRSPLVDRYRAGLPPVTMAQ